MIFIGRKRGASRWTHAWHMAIRCGLALVLATVLCTKFLFSTSPSPLTHPSHQQGEEDPQDLRAWQPRGIHLALGNESDSMLIQWITTVLPTRSYARFAPLPLNHTDEKLLAVLEQRTEDESSSPLEEKFTVVEGEQRPFYYRGHRFIVHAALMRKLLPSTRYFYQVGADSGRRKGEWSQPYAFRSLPTVVHNYPALLASQLNSNFTLGIQDGEQQNNESSSPPYLSMAVYGDMGLVNPVSLPSIIAGAKEGRFDVIVHIGDIGYDLFNVGLEFLDAVQEAAARVPYMVVPGNHERFNDSWYLYDMLFRMPNTPTDGSSNQFYSVNLTPHVHMIGLDTELYYNPLSNYTSAVQQLDWLEADLKRVKQGCKESFEEGKKSPSIECPWVLVFLHRPLYCSGEHKTNCRPEDSKKLREGIADEVPGLEAAFHHHHAVDVVFAGHEHFYERFNRSSPLYLVTGAAGNSHRLQKFSQQPAEGSLVRAQRYSYTLVKVWDSGRMSIEQIAVGGSEQEEEGKNPSQPPSNSQSEERKEGRMMVLDGLKEEVIDSVELRRKEWDAADNSSTLLSE